MCFISKGHSPVPDAHQLEGSGIPQPGQSLVTHTVHVGKGERGVAQGSFLVLERLPSPPVSPASPLRTLHLDAQLLQILF